MVILRFQRIGRKKAPHFRLIAQDKKKDQWDKSIEILGWKNPRSKEKELKKDRIEHWLSVGAQCTDSVHNWLVAEGIIKDDKRKSIKISKKRKEKLSEKEKSQEEKSETTAETPTEEDKKETEETKETSEKETPAEEKAEDKKE